jgi:hypothetical protein
VPAGCSPTGPAAAALGMRLRHPLPPRPQRHRSRGTPPQGPQGHPRRTPLGQPRLRPEDPRLARGPYVPAEPGHRGPRSPGRPDLLSPVAVGRASTPAPAAMSRSRQNSPRRRRRPRPRDGGLIPRAERRLRSRARSCGGVGPGSGVRCPERMAGRGDDHAGSFASWRLRGGSSHASAPPLPGRPSPALVGRTCRGRVIAPHRVSNPGPCWSATPWATTCSTWQRYAGKKPAIRRATYRRRHQPTLMLSS